MSAASSTATPEKPAPTHTATPGSTRFVYGILDLLLAALYLFVFLRLVPSRSGGFTALAVLFSLVWGLGGVGMFVWGRWGRRAAVAAAVSMLVVCVLLLIGLAASAAYLHGIYDGIGQAGVVISAVVAALVVELVGILPVLQLAFLWRTRATDKKAS